jgi:hypothetical protein
VGAQRLRKHDTSVLVDGDDVHITIERDRQLVPLIRIIRQAIEKPVDGLGKALAARIERGSIKRGVAVNAPRDPRRIAVTLNTARNEAGTETRPLASILFVNVETKRSIPCVSLAYTPTKRPTLILRARISLAPRRRSERSGGLWAYMGLHGL